MAQTIKNSVSISWQLKIQSSHPNVITSGSKKQHKCSQIANVEAFVWGIQNPTEDVTVAPSVQICSLWEAVGLREGEQELEDSASQWRQQQQGQFFSNNTTDLEIGILKLVKAKKDEQMVLPGGRNHYDGTGVDQVCVKQGPPPTAV